MFFRNERKRERQERQERQETQEREERESGGKEADLLFVGKHYLPPLVGFSEILVNKQPFWDQYFDLLSK